ncbi:MAG TPA: lipocalin, partial [Deltaproteobacteria bacterium]|nr:lipocalin [Deltaproteobacteria bacterium]
RVINRCYLDSLDGDFNEIEGSASFVDDTYARLLVDFGFGFEAPYNLVELDGRDGDAEYEFAVVSSPGFALWVLSRTPEMDPELYDLLVDRATDRGLPSDTLVATVQVD